MFPGFTKKYNVHRLVYFEAYLDMDEARQRERQLKGLNRAKKDVLVTSLNPERRDPSLRSGHVAAAFASATI